MSMTSLLINNFVVLCVAFAVMFLICLWLRDPTPIDAYWGLGMGVLATSTFLQLSEPNAHSWLLLILCWIWAIRLAAYMLWRWHDHGPDRRYVRMFEKSKEKRGWGIGMSLLMLVILPQGALQFVISLPVQLGQLSSAPSYLGPVAWLGLLIAVLGLGWETIADIQLTAFRKDPANKGQVLRNGLWKYSRHPNYFGEACFWWGAFLIAAESPAGRWSVISPVILTWILVKWSGVPTMEFRMRKNKPGYREYIETTSAIIPLPPRKKETRVT
jgi:steroid 5-alpha reductase family enzyme